MIRHVAGNAFYYSSFDVSATVLGTDQGQARQTDQADRSVRPIRDRQGTGQQTDQGGLIRDRQGRPIRETDQGQAMAFGSSTPRCLAGILNK